MFDVCEVPSEVDSMALDNPRVKQMEFMIFLMEKEKILCQYILVALEFVQTLWKCSDTVAVVKIIQTTTSPQGRSSRFLENISITHSFCSSVYYNYNLE
jgi:hypothetical protein